MNFVITLENQRIDSLEEFGRKMYLYEDASEVLLTSNKFLKFLKEFDNDKYRKLIELNHSKREHEEFIFLAQYIFCPLMNIRHHGYEFNSLKELGQKIISFGPEVDIYLKDFLKYHLLSQYMEMMGLDKREEDNYIKVKKLEKLFLENENKAYFLLGFILAECDIITYCRRSYSTVNEFFKDMVYDKNIVAYSSLLDKSQYVISWLTYLGFQTQVDRYQSMINSIKTLEDNYECRTKISKMDQK